MQLFGGIAIGLVSFFFSVEATKIYVLFFVPYLRHPTFIFFFHPRQPPNALNSTFVTAFTVCPVLPMCRFTKIFKPIVRFISVNMVNLKLRHRTRYIEPRKTVCRIGFPIYFNVAIPLVFFNIPRLRSNLNSGARARPCKYPGLGIVRKDGCKVRMFHKGILPDFREDCNLQGIKYA